jgi:hypothetical protein
MSYIFRVYWKFGGGYIATATFSGCFFVSSYTFRVIILLIYLPERFLKKCILKKPLLGAYGGFLRNTTLNM